MGVFSWWNIVPATIGGLVGGCFALLGMWITGRRERRRSAEVHEREMLIGAQQALLGILDLYTTELSDRADWELADAAYGRMERLLREVGVYAAGISDHRIRDLLEFSTYALSTSAIRQFQGDHDWKVASVVCNHGLDVIAARLRDADPPAEPKAINEYRLAIQEAEEIWRQQDVERKTR